MTFWLALILWHIQGVNKYHVTQFNLKIPPGDPVSLEMSAPASERASNQASEKAGSEKASEKASPNVAPKRERAQPPQQSVSLSGLMRMTLQVFVGK